ncbi:hypothetical protein [Saccharothrix sp. HUAS TT10]|uniref:hypothetical protein n=1 Tax=Saccharothrix sp. HUAS TT10 TaxID=3447450 RepID=UPI003F6E9AD4
MADTVAAGPAGAGLVATRTRFSVDPEQAQKLIDGLLDARDRLQELYDQSHQLTGISSPGKDPYSGFATLAIHRAGGTEAGGYGWANQEAYKALDNTIKNIEAALETYKNQDRESEDAFKREGNQA